MAAPDPVDIRLLSLVAESGKAAVHELAARLGMDPREVAARLVALSGTGLPLIVGVECDPNGLRAAIAGAGAWLNYAAQHQNTPYQNTQYQGTPSGPYPQRGYNPYPGPMPGHPSGPHPVQARPPVLAPPRPVPFPAPGADPISTWGPPQSSSWARGDQPTRPAAWTPPRSARVGETLHAESADGEPMTIQLVEVVDPADFLFTAAGYRLRPGERAVVVHTELTNQGTTPLATLPDLYLVLVAEDGSTISKAPVSLQSRPPHRIGVRPGDTAGGHTVYVLPEDTEIRRIRWSPRPDDERDALTWTVEQ